MNEPQNTADLKNIPEQPAAADQQKELYELLKRLEAANAGQELYAKKQYRMSQISAAACVLMLIVVLACAVVLMPKVLHLFDQVDAITQKVDVVFEEIDTLYDQISVVMKDLESITSGLADTLPEMMTNLDTLMETSSEGITEAIDKVSSIDIKTLNNAIADLQAIVEPISKLFGGRR